MAASYLVLAIVLAFALNHSNGLIRAAGTLIAALGLAMIVVSIILADFDGTFSALPPRSDRLDTLNPLILNIQAVAGAIATVFLVWAAWLQTRRSAAEPISRFNTKTGFGLVSRYAHWITATLMLCLIPMGLFIAVLREDSPDRAGFVAAHQSLGLALIPIVALRLLWLLASPPPLLPKCLRRGERLLAQVVHLALYCLILAFPVSGYLMTAYKGDAVQFFGWIVPALVAPDTRASVNWAAAHNIVLPFAFYAIIFAHVGGVLKHHFVDGRAGAIRRMLT
jgi:cytochrome b561